MQGGLTISFGEAAASWLVGRTPRLSGATERSYRGEVDRLAQFFAVKYGLLDIGQFGEEHWLDYLAELGEARDHVVTSRRASLSTSSANQAARILRAFLRWAREEGLISWSPRDARYSPSARPRRRTPLVDLSRRETMHPAVVEVLHTAPSAAATLEELRAKLAIGVAYWLGFKTADIAALRLANITLREDSLEVRISAGAAAQIGPLPLAASWAQYRDLREKQGVGLRPQSPVIAAIGSDEPVSAWTVWAVISRTLGDLTGIRGHNAQSLRRSRMWDMTRHCANDVDQLAIYAQRSTVDIGASNSQRRAHADYA